MSPLAVDVVKAIAHVSVAGVAFAVGLEAARAPPERDRSAVVRGLIAALVGVPLIAFILAQTMPLPDPVRAGLLIIAVSVGPVAALKNTAKSGGARSDAVVLNLALMGASLVYVPLMAFLFGRLFHRELGLHVWAVAKVVVPLQLIPLVAGLFVGRLAPELKARIGRPVAVIANLTLGLVALAVIIALAKPMLALGGRALWSVLLLALGAAVLGHAVGGRDPAMRGMLAAFTTLRFPALALVVCSLTRDPKATLPVIGAYVIASLLALPVVFRADRFITGGKGRDVTRRPSSARA